MTIPTDFILMPRATLMALPIGTKSWNAVVTQASATGKFSLGDQNANGSSVVLASALVYARTGATSSRTKVINAVKKAAPTAGNTSGGGDGRSLALAREAGAYILAMDLVGATTADLGFGPKEWASSLLTKRCTDGKTISTIAADRPNNWGTHARASVTAIGCFTGDVGLVSDQAIKMRGWLGDRSAYAGYKYGDLSWQFDATKPGGINPKGATKQGHSIDGVLPDDQRRGGSFTWPPPRENYVWEALQGASLSGVLLARCGYDVWQWSDQALLRAVKWLYSVDQYPATGDDTFIPPIIERAYGVTFAHPTPTSPGKGFGFSDWLWP